MSLATATTFKATNLSIFFSVSGKLPSTTLLQNPSELSQMSQSLLSFNSADRCFRQLKKEKARSWLHGIENFNSYSIMIRISNSPEIHQCFQTFP